MSLLMLKNIFSRIPQPDEMRGLSFGELLLVQCIVDPKKHKLIMNKENYGSKNFMASSDEVKLAQLHSARQNLKAKQKRQQLKKEA